jgi:hypothetical protein
MNKLIGAIFLSSITILAQTNQFYVTDVRLKNFGSFVPTPDQIESARHSKESRPAEHDREGNWGEVTDGFQLSIRLEKKLFTNGEPILASILLRNTSDKVLTYYDDTTKNAVFQIFARKGGQKFYGKYEIKPGMTFLEQLNHVNRGSQWAAVAGPGTQRKFVVELTNLFDFSTNGEYEVQASQEIGTINAIDITNKAALADAMARKIAIITNVVSGNARFDVTNSAIK